MIPRPVYVVDDEEPIRRSMDMLLRTMKLAPDLFSGGEAFLECASSLAPGCVLLDLRMPDMDGLEVQRHLTGAASPHSLIVMSGHGDIDAVLTAMEQGAIAFLEKPFSRTALEQLLQIGFLRLEDPGAYRSHLQSAASAVAALAEADREVLDLIVRGNDLHMIAEHTRLPHAAVEIARSRIFAQLGATSLVDALRVAFLARRAAIL
ncbi:response regulator transcription factor [Tsuneonella sp. HG249]